MRVVFGAVMGAVAAATVTVAVAGPPSAPAEVYAAPASASVTDAPVPPMPRDEVVATFGEAAAGAGAAVAGTPSGPDKDVATPPPVGAGAVATAAPTPAGPAYGTDDTGAGRQAAPRAPPADAAPPRPPAASPPPPLPAPPAAPPLGRACPTTLAGAVPHAAAAGHHLAQRHGVPLASVLGRAARAGASDHPSGHALDFLVGRSTGDALAEYAVAERSRLGVTYVIWRQRYNDGSGWEPMEDRGGATANHFDHVHVSFARTAPAERVSC